MTIDYTAIDTFVTWFAKQPLAFFLVGYIGARVFLGIVDMCKSPSDYVKDKKNKPFLSRAA